MMRSDIPQFLMGAVPEEPMGSLQAIGEGFVCGTLRLQGDCDVVSHAVSESKAHLGIIAESGCSATIFLSLSGDECVVEAFIGSSASLHIVCIMESGVKPMTATLKSRTEAGGSVYWHTVMLGQATEQSLSSELVGVDARSDIDCLFCVDDTDRQTLHVLNDFQAPNGAGEIRMRGIAENKGFATCTGKILIGEAGRGTDTYLTQDVLMLDSTAKIDAEPGLEIRTNDVKASHSATVSRVTEEDLFYFASRGLEESVARPMFIDGFLREALMSITDDHVRDAVETMVLARK